MPPRRNQVGYSDQFFVFLGRYNDDRTAFGVTLPYWLGL